MTDIYFTTDTQYLTIPDINLNPYLAPGKTIEVTLPIEDLTPTSSWKPNARGIELEIGFEFSGEYLAYVYYNPIPTDITLDNDVLDISGGGWYYLNL